MIISGCGFLGEAAADLFSGTGWEVLGLCATEESAERLREKPYAVRAADVAEAGALHKVSEGWDRPDLLVHSASSRGGDAEAYHRIYFCGLRTALEVFCPRRVLFASSTSVYAQTDGALVTEESPADPPRETGKILLEAERIALEHGGWGARLGGLYGPGRSAFLRKFLSGEAQLEDGGGRWINQIHRDDAAHSIFHLVTANAPSGIYNVVDDMPATQREIYGWLAGALQKPFPPEGPADPHRKRGNSSKRVSNAKLRATGWSPRYPSYRDAIPELHAKL